MKRLALTGLGIYVGWLEYGDDVIAWLPAFGGDALWQTLILGLLTLAVFGTVVWAGYQVLGSLLD
jgi:hypothetical protein